MDLKGIISIAGKPGLYKVAAQGRNNIIVQSLENNKKFPAFSSDKISALDDISIYTYEKDVPLVEVFIKLGKKEDFKPSLNHKEDAKKLREYLITFLPDYDAERVYDTDVKKLFQWYNILIDKEIITKENVEKATSENNEQTEEEKEKKKPQSIKSNDTPTKKVKSAEKGAKNTKSSAKSAVAKKPTVTPKKG